MAEGLIVRIAHAGASTTSILISDLEDGTDTSSGVRTRKAGPVYVPVAGSVDLAYTSDVARSLESGAIYQFEQAGEITVTLVAGDKLAEVIVGRLEFATLQFTDSDLTAGATSEELTFAEALPANARVQDAFLDITTLFSGGAISAVAVDIGVNAGDTNGFAEDVPAFTGDPTGRQNGTRGVLPDGGGVTPSVTVKTTGGDVNELTAGEATAYVVYSIIE